MEGRFSLHRLKYPILLNLTHYTCITGNEQGEGITERGPHRPLCGAENRKLGHERYSMVYNPHERIKTTGRGSLEFRWWCGGGGGEEPMAV